MATSPKFRRVVDYEDIEALLQCMFYNSMCKSPPILETHSRLVNMKDVLEASETCIVFKTSRSFFKVRCFFSALIKALHARE